MNRRSFIKSGALFVPTIFVPRLIRAQGIGRSPAFRGAAAQQGRPASGGGGGNGLLTGLIAYWRCEESDGTDLADATGNGHTLTHHGATLQTPLSAKHNLGVKISSSQYLDSSSSDFRRTGSWTFAGWYRVAASVDGEVPACEFGVGNPTNGHNWFIFGPGSNILEFGMRNADDGGSTLAVSTVTMSTGSYHHIAVGWDSVAQKIWIQVDNETRVETSYTDTPRTDSENFTVNGFSGGGNGIDGTSNNGGIDEIAYWTRSLSTTDVTNLQTKFYDDFD